MALLALALGLGRTGRWTNHTTMGMINGGPPSQKEMGKSPWGTMRVELRPRGDSWVMNVNPGVPSVVQLWAGVTAELTQCLLWFRHPRFCSGEHLCLQA